MKKIDTDLKCNRKHGKVLPDCSSPCSVLLVEYLVYPASHELEFYPSPKLEYKHAIEKSNISCISINDKEWFFQGFHLSVCALCLWMGKKHKMPT